MGMDVYGLAPTSEAGQYFRNTVWYWRPLAHFLTSTYPGLTAGCTYWQSNDGDGLDAAASTALAAAVRADLRDGAVDSYAATWAQELAALPRLTCEWCNGSGARTDEVGRRYGYDQPGRCNGCSGKGTTDHPDTHYPFEVANVRTFAAFLNACGGFEIH